MSNLTLTQNIDKADDFYAELLAVHDGLSPEASGALNARLILILANHIGNRAILSDAIKAAALK